MNSNSKLKCPDCGANMKDWRIFSEKSELDKKKPFECVECGYQNNADVVGAINVLKRGQDFLAAQ